MAIHQLNVVPSRESLLHAAERLPLGDLTHLVQDLLSLQARRQAPVLSETESELLEKINQELPSVIQARYDALIEKRLAETLTQVEHQELLQLNQQVEQANVERIKALSNLAKLRQISLPALMNELGITPPSYVG